MATSIARQSLPSWATEFFHTVFGAIQQLGLVKGTFVVFFWVMHYAVFKLYRGRLSDRQREIDRLAADNHEYRDRWLQLHDKQQGYVPTVQKPAKSVKAPSNKERK